MMMRAGPESAKRAERWDDDDDDEDREEEDYNDDDDDEEIERDERPLPGVGNPVSFVGMNFCGADPSLPCVMKVWRTADEAFEHVLAEHMRFYESKYWCQWWGCDFSVARKSKMESHYQKHMVGEWRCGICSEMFPDKRLAVGCVHLNRLVELVAQYSFCEYEGCSKPGVQMSSLKLRDHISEHVDLEPTQATICCKWKGCKTEVKFSAYVRHLQSVHLRLQWRCLSCDKWHKVQKQALACCSKEAVEEENTVVLPEPEVVTLGCKCVWGKCGLSFPEGSGEELKKHIKEHLEEEPGQFQCQWQKCKSKSKIDSAAKLARHVEQVHCKLRLKCSMCGKLKPLNRKQEVINCDHVNPPKKKKPSKQKN